MLSFAHHVIPLLFPPGTAGTSGGKPNLLQVRETCKSATRIHGAIKMSGRYELAVVPYQPDFFDPMLASAKARNLAWETIRDTPRLQWVITTTNPENITGALPPTWIGKGFQNVCIGLVFDSTNGLSEKLQVLRSIPVQHRMIHIMSPTYPIDITEHLKGIDWVVLSETAQNVGIAETIKPACQKAGASFLHHILGKDIKAGAIGDHPENPLTIRQHPFGNKIDLSKPTLPDLKPSSDIIPPTLCLIKNELAPSPMTLSTSVVERPPVHLDFEVVTQGRAKPESTEDARSLETINTADQADFARLDRVVSRGLSTFIEVGQALGEIRDRELWRAGKHVTWAAYCKMVGGLTKSHANRLIISANIAERIAQVTPTGVTPTSESQVRPLCKLQPEHQTRAWTSAIERANGQPTAQLLSDVVAEFMAGESTPQKSKPDRKQLRTEAFCLLRDAVRAKSSLKEIELRLSELEIFL